MQDTFAIQMYKQDYDRFQAFLVNDEGLQGGRSDRVQKTDEGSKECDRKVSNSGNCFRQL